MVLDTSAAIAILMNEPESEKLAAQLISARSVQMSAVSFMEASMVLISRKGPDGVHALDHFVQELNVHIEPVDLMQARVARDAFAVFGKRRHKANLNFGDCFSYALAKTSHEVLLFKGNDFIHTDVLRILSS